MSRVHFLSQPWRSARLLALLATLALLSLVSEAHAGVAEASDQGSAHALVIGNGAYGAWPQLSGAPEDAAHLGAALTRLGFRTTVETNLDQTSMSDALEDFFGQISSLGRSGLVLLYFGGHGLIVDGELYFVPTDLPTARASDLARVSALNLGAVTALFSERLLATPLFVFDMGLVEPGTAFQRGLVRLGGHLDLRIPANAVIAFSTRLGGSPYDVSPFEGESEAGLGPYAQVLAEALGDGYHPLEAILEDTRARLIEKSDGKLRPWHISTLIAPGVTLKVLIAGLEP